MKPSLTSIGDARVWSAKNCLTNRLCVSCVVSLSVIRASAVSSLLLRSVSGSVDIALLSVFVVLSTRFNLRCTVFCLIMFFILL